jgi:hypothetical protein
MGVLCFTGKAGRRVYDQVERGLLNGVSCSLDIENVAIFDSDGDQLNVDDPLAQRDDPALNVVVTRSVLREVSITSVPADRNCFVRSLSVEAEAWRMIEQGELALRQILRPDRDHDIGDDATMWNRVLADLQGLRHGAAEPFV